MVKMNALSMFSDYKRILNSCKISVLVTGANLKLTGFQIHLQNNINT